MTDDLHNGNGLIDKLIKRREEVLDLSAAGTVGTLLGQAAEAVGELLARDGRQPTAVHLRAGIIEIELSWCAPAELADGTPAAAQSAPTTAAGSAQLSVFGAPVATTVASAGPAVLSPTVGVFYRAPSPGAEPFVREGSTVAQGQQIGIVEAMKLMIPVEADRAGTIAEVLVEDGEPVEYATPLFTLIA